MQIIGACLRWPEMEGLLVHGYCELTYKEIWVQITGAWLRWPDMKGSLVHGYCELTHKGIWVQIRLHAEPVNPAEPNNFVEVLESMTNLGPIIDFVVVDLERQGQGQVLLSHCSCPEAVNNCIVRAAIGKHPSADVGAVLACLFSCSWLNRAAQKTCSPVYTGTNILQKGTSPYQ